MCAIAQQDRTVTTRARFQFKLHRGSHAMRSGFSLDRFLLQLQSFQRGLIGQHLGESLGPHAADLIG